MTKVQILTKMGGEGPQIPMGSLLTHQSRLDPHAPVLTIGDETLTREELEIAANRRARALAALGVGHNDFVTIALPNGRDFYETVLAVWKLGAIPNPVSSKLPAAEIGAILHLVQPALAVGDAARQTPGRFVPGDWTPDLSLSGEPLPEIVGKHWKAVPSGGSTGRPKVIVDNHPSRWNPNTTMTGQLPGDTALNGGPLYHNAPFCVTAITMFTGGHVVEMLRFDALEALRLIAAHRVEYTCMVPTMMHRIWRLPAEERLRFDLSSLRTLMHMAAPCPPWLKQAWIDWLGEDVIWETYAGTENVGATTIRGGEWLSHPGSVGKATRGTLMILDDKGNQLPPGEVGEVHFRRDEGWPKPYFYLGARSGESDVESIGDLGWVDEEGYLYLADRRTDLIISGGANIYAAEVEAAIDAMPGVASCAVIGLPDADLGQCVHAIVQVADPEEVDEQRLCDFLADQLVRYKIPRTFEFVPHALRDDAGKSRRSKLVAERTGSQCLATNRPPSSL